MCRRAQHPARGKWTIPSGYLECGETLEEGAARETLEETGIVVLPSSLKLCSILDMPDIEQVGIVFRTELTAEAGIHLGNECLEAAFLREGEIPAEQLAWREALGDDPTRFFFSLRHADLRIQRVPVGSKFGVI